MKRKVLIVDDMRTNRIILGDILKSDFDVLEASSGNEALDILESAGDKISAVLLDINMPVTDGYETVRRMRSNSKLSNLPVIMVTGSDDDESRVKSLALGANDYVTKPYNSDIINHCLHNHIAFHEAEKAVESLNRDKLTGLWNRDAFFERAGDMIRLNTEEDYCLSCFDIEKFKLINDRYGTEKGDAVLKNIADVLKQCCDDKKTLCGRMSADNFAILFPASLLYNGVADDRFSKISNVNGLSPNTVICTGRYIITDRSLSVSAIYDRAKIAQATVKHISDIHVAVYNESMREEILLKQSIIGDIRTALSEHQFETWFQPQYNYESGAMIGAEALVRWNHPERGLIMPGVFIPIAEQNGFVYDIDKYVWEDVCRCLRKWLDEGRNPLPVSVNISRYDIMHPDLTKFIASLLEKYSLAANMLRLEITESAFSVDTDMIIGVVKEFISLGFTVEIDDFGSGYSSLNTLKDVPAQVLKLDMKFLQGKDSERGGNIVESVVRMAKWLGMSVIAEGVETYDQVNYLLSIGCIYIQGYLLAKPMPMQKYESLCKHITKEEHLIKLHTVDNLDNNKFWDPISLDSLIFNSYVGAACIFEYNSGRIEIIRATHLFAQLLDDKITFSEIMKLDLSDYFDADGNKKMLSALRVSAERKKQITAEFILTGLPGCTDKLYIRCTLRVIATTDARMLVYCLNENVTKQRLAERDMLEADGQIHFLNEMSHELLAHPETGEGIKSVLYRLLDYFKGNRAYIFEYNRIKGFATNTYEVCAEGICAEAGKLQIIPSNVLSHWFEDFTRRGFYAIDDISKLKEDRAEEKRILRKQGIRSLFAVPICRDGEIIGLIGIDNPKIKIELVSRFSSLGDYLAVMLTRRDLNKQIESDTTALSDMMSDMPGGFARMTLSPDGVIKTVFVNKPFCVIRGLTPEEIYRQDSENALNSVHPDDLEALCSTLTKLEQTGDVNTAQYRLKRSDGTFIPVNVFARITSDSDGQTYINAYYTEMTEHEKYEYDQRTVMSRTLSAIMKSSNDYSFAKDGSLRYICCSPAFLEISGFDNEKDVIGKTDYDLFTEDVASRFRQNDNDIIKSGKPMIDFNETVYDRVGRAHFCRASKYVLHGANGEVIGLYGVSRDITNEHNAYEQLKLLTDSIPGGIAVYNGVPEALDKIRLSYFSDGFCQLFGYTRAEYEKISSVNSLCLIASDMDEMYKNILALVRDGVTMDYVYKAKTRSGDYKWINVKAVLGAPIGDELTVNAVFFDVTKQRNTLERLRMSEEENAFAVKHGGNTVCRYTIADRTLSVSTGLTESLCMPEILTDIPCAPVCDEMISPETAVAYVNFFKTINKGGEPGTVLFRQKYSGRWVWTEAKGSIVFSDDGKPFKAIISMFDVSDRVEKELVYKHWQQTLSDLSPESHTLYRLNLNGKKTYDIKDGSLISFNFNSAGETFNERTKKYASECIFEDDRELYISFMNRDTLIADYYTGKMKGTLEYRELVSSGKTRWLRLTVDLTASPDSTDVEAFLLYEDIDKAKCAELRTKKLSELDSLTGILNRAAFISRADGALSSDAAGHCHALLMIDIDGFKMVNDVFGHTAGDRALADIAAGLQKAVGNNGYVGRLGGDEFVAFLKDIKDEHDALEKAGNICAMTRKSYGHEVLISCSIGVVMTPRDGTDFMTLYKKADAALYYVKGTGKDNVAAFKNNMQYEHFSLEDEEQPGDVLAHAQKPFC